MSQGSNQGTYTFGSDRPLLYDVEPWNRLGFAVPNFGENVGTVSMPIWGLADEIGKAQLFIMSHIDAQRTQPPSLNTVQRIGKVLNRVQSIMVGRMKDYSETRIEEVHATADIRPWQIHPVPFFTSAIVRNRWLSEYNRLVMIAMTNMYQHSDNNLALTVTKKFAQEIWQYFAEIKLLVGIELLGLPAEAVKPDTFVFNDAAYANYVTIEDRVMNFEGLDSPGPIASRHTEDDLRPLFTGIPANLIYPLLKQYPVGEGQYGWSGEALQPASAAVGTQDGSGTAAAGGTIGQPQV